MKRKHPGVKLQRKLTEKRHQPKNNQFKAPIIPRPSKSVNNKRSNPESRLTEVSENVLARNAPTKNVPLKKIKTEVNDLFVA